MKFLASIVQRYRPNRQTYRHTDRHTHIRTGLKLLPTHANGNYTHINPLYISLQCTEVCDGSRTLVKQSFLTVIKILGHIEDKILFGNY